MKNRFILIDHSISSLAGHHYEYAVHVLEAAEKAGFEPHLVTNRAFRDSAEAPWSVHPIYKYGFWAPHSTAMWDQGFAGFRSYWHRFRFHRSCRFRYSMAGVLWAVRDQFSDFLLRQPVDRHHLLALLPWIPLMVFFKLMRFAAMLILLAPALLFLLIRGVVRGIWRISLVREGAHRLFSDFNGLLRLVRHFLAQSEVIRRWIREFRCLRRFRRDTGRLFAKIGLREGDLIFIPTISPVDMMGLRLFIQKNPSRVRASWHLLFRRDIYRGREGNYPSQDPWVAPTGQVFQSFRGQLHGQQAFFFTDTEELTAQYNRLGVVPFHTLAIPHTHPPRRGGPRDRPLRIIYMGDARREKGYHLLPHLVQDLWRDYVEPGRVVFAFQSNFNIPHGEPEAVIARSQLDGVPRKSVEILKQPLTSEQYRELLLSGDINLLLYDPENYYARSSGILVESLAAGIPVVVPAGTWLARQFLDELYRHQETLRDSMENLASFELGDLTWCTPSDNEGSIQREVIAGNSSKVYSIIEAPEGADVLMVAAAFGQGPSEALLTLDQLDAEGESLESSVTALIEGAPSTRRAVYLMRVRPEAEKIWIGWQCPYAGSAALIRELRLDFLTGERPPLGAVGLCYHDTAEISALLRELIDHYPHYRATAMRFSEAWRARHNAAELVRKLADVAGVAQTTAETAGVQIA